MAKKIDQLLAEAFTEKKLISKKDSDALLKEAESSGKGILELAMLRHLGEEATLLDIVAERLQLARLDLRQARIESAVLERVPVKIASYYKFLPVKIEDKTLIIAVAVPLDIKTQDEIRTQLGLDIKMALAPSAQIAEGLRQYYGLAAETLGQISRAAKAGEREPLQASEAIEDIEKLAGDASVIKLVNQIILEGWRKRATDIHIEPYRGGVSLRYRIDGLLYDTNAPQEIVNFLNAIISRIKIMSNLNIVERRLPQDGRAVVKVQNQQLDLRISTLPTPHGESVVIRILPTHMLFSLEKLGLSKRDLKIFEGLILKPHGIILVTGPTGSGKTTTLYACLSRINTKERKIVTIEDPIEYEMSGVTQIQVMPEIGLDFARGLRSILRHDPDIIMVGEIRDLETAEIAIRVALTGHLVFSTLHTNDAASGITRLIDIGVEPYLAASSVEAFIAQRLIRLICPDCRYEDEKAPAELKIQIAKELGSDSPEEIKIYRGRGCPSCNFTGFFGRTAIYEVLLIDESIKELILKKATSGQIKRAAVAKGMRTLRQDGWQKTIAGLTTPEEVMKVTTAEEGEVNEAAPLFSAAGPVTDAPALPKEDNRRVYRRLKAEVNLRYRVFKSRDELARKGYKFEHVTVTKDLSAGGILFAAKEPLEPGVILELTIEIPDGEEPINCLARVVRIEKLEEKADYEVAACLLDITGAQRQRLNSYVEHESIR